MLPVHLRDPLLYLYKRPEQRWLLKNVGMAKNCAECIRECIPSPLARFFLFSCLNEWILCMNHSLKDIKILNGKLFYQ
jgi:hypothetical protein